MRRPETSYDGKRYLLNRNTGEIHDLDNEQSQCKIDEITNFLTGNDLSALVTLGKTLIGKKHKINGCYYCLNDYHSD